MPISLVSRLILATFTVFAVALGTLSPVSAVETGGVGGRPANPNPDNTRTKSIFVYRLDPGATKKDAVEIFNNSSSTKRVVVYATDATIGSGGSFACKQRAEDTVGVGKWVSIDSTAVTLESGESKEVAFDVTVPSNAPAGEQNGCIAIEEVSQTPTDTGNGVSITTRSAIRLAVTVPGEITTGIDILNLAAKTEADKLLLSTSLRNNGNVSLDSELTIELKNVFGISEGKVGGTFPVLPSVQSDYNFSIDKPFWGGIYTLSATANYSDSKDAVLGTSKNNTSTSTSEVIYIAPAPLAAFLELVFIILLVALAVYLYKARVTNKKWRNYSTEYTVGSGENIQSIAAAHNVSWKTLARQNNIKAPYQLESGQKLRILKTPSTAKKTASPKKGS